MEIKDSIYTYRVINKLKQYDIADKLGISQSLYSLIETGKKKPNNQILHKINKLIK